MPEGSANKKFVLTPIMISIFAIILSQMKPIYTYFEKPKLDILVGKSMMVYETWGNLSSNLFVQLVNRGGAGGLVEKVSIFIKSRDSDYSHILNGQTYFLQPEAVGQNDIVSQIPFSYVTVDSGSIWTGYISTFADVSKSQQAKIQDIIQRTSEDISSKFVQGGPVVTIEPALMEEIRSFTRGNLRGFGIGEHQLLVMGWAQGDQTPSLMKAYSFSVYENDTSRLRAKEEGYPYGSGITFPLNPNIGRQANFNSTLTEVDDEKTRQRLYEAYKQELL